MTDTTDDWKDEIRLTGWDQTTVIMGEDTDGEIGICDSEGYSIIVAREDAEDMLEWLTMFVRDRRTELTWDDLELDLPEAAEEVRGIVEKVVEEMTAETPTKRCVMCQELFETDTPLFTTTCTGCHGGQKVLPK
jgi:hypothetical protein